MIQATLGTLLGCSGPSGGSCQQAVASSGGLTSGKPSETLGGYIDLDLEGKGQSRCSAQVTPQRTSDPGAWNLDVTFSRHCFNYDLASIRATALHLFNGNRFEGNLPVTLDLVDKKARAKAALKEIGISDDAVRKTLVEFFTEPYEATKKSTNSLCTPDPASPSELRKPEHFAVSGKQVLCFEFDDFAQMRGTLRLNDLATESQRKAVNQLLGQFEQPEQVDEGALSAADQAAFNYARMRRERARATDELPHTAFVDFAVIGCNKDVSDEDIAHAAADLDESLPINKSINTVSRQIRQKEIDSLRSLEPALCSQKEAVVSALRPLLTIQQKDPIAFLADAGFSDPLHRSPSSLYIEKLMPTQGIYTVVGELRKHFQEKLSAAASLAFHAQSAQKQNTFSVALLPGTTAEAFGPSRFLLQIPEQPGTPRFQKTDSGAILMLGGVFPVAVLSSVDGEFVSGGASVVPLDFEQHEVVAAQTRYPDRPSPVAPKTDAGLDTSESNTTPGEAPAPSPVGQVTNPPRTGQAPLPPPSARPGPDDGTASYEPDVPLDPNGSGDPYSVESAQIDGNRRAKRLPEEGTCY